MYVKATRTGRYRSPNFREQNTRAVSIDEDGRVYLFGNEVSPIVVDDRFHFFEEVLDSDDWERVRAYYDLCKRKRHTCRSHGVRRGEGSLVGLFPKRSIHLIQEERGKEAGEKSWRMPAYGKALERMIEKDMAAESESGDLAANGDWYFPDEERPF